MVRQFEMKGRTVRPVPVRALLRSLADDEAGANDVAIRFDVRRGYQTVLHREETEEVSMTAPITLATYNELKLSQYLVEDAEHSTPYEWQFLLADRGRHLAIRRLN